MTIKRLKNHIYECLKNVKEFTSIDTILISVSTDVKTLNTNGKENCMQITKGLDSTHYQSVKAFDGQKGYSVVFIGSLGGQWFIPRIKGGDLVGMLELSGDMIIE